MGCDIHMFAEIRTKNGWQKVGKRFRRRDYLNPNKNATVPTDEPYHDRNYGAFAILAGVRNYISCDPISEPRGLPKDISAKVKHLSDGWSSDGHSHSWLSVAELLAFDWEGKYIDHVGLLDGTEYLEFLRYGHPLSWVQQNMRGSDCTEVTHKEMERLIKADQYATLECQAYTKIHWKFSYAYYCQVFLTRVLPQLKALKKDPNDARIVFWFDN